MIGLTPDITHATVPQFFFFKQKTAYEIMPRLVGSEMCIRDRLGGGQLSCRFWRLCHCPASTALGAASIRSPGDRSDDGDDTTLRRFGFVRLLRPVTALTGEVTSEADHQNLPATLFS